MPFEVAYSALFMKGYQVAYRVLYCGNTWLDNMTQAEAMSHCKMLNESCGMEAA
jgi:hypothetical protein